MMVKLSVRCPYVPIASFPHSQTKIHVTECDRQFFLVQPANLLIDRLLHNETGCCHSRERRDQTRSCKVAILALVDLMVGMPGDAAQAKHYPAMLEGLIRIPQLGTHRTHFRTQGMADHLGQPIRRDDVDIVVYQADPRAPARTPTGRGTSGPIPFHRAPHRAEIGSYRPLLTSRTTRSKGRPTRPHRTLLDETVITRASCK